MVDTNQDSRLKKPAGAGRDDRSSEDVRRQDADGTSTTVSERRSRFRNEWTQEALPTPPAIPGYHLCWASTTNSYDPIHKRIRMGYELVKVSEVPGFENYKMNSGEYEGFVVVNEMILMKMPLDLYNELMQELHHFAPMDEEEKLRSAAQMARDSNGKQLGMIEGDGIASLGTKVSTPNFY